MDGGGIRPGWVFVQGQGDNGDVDRFHVVVQPNARYAVELRFPADPGVPAMPDSPPSAWMQLWQEGKDSFDRLPLLAVPIDTGAATHRLVFVTPPEGQLNLAAIFQAWGPWAAATYAIELGPVAADDHGDTLATATRVTSASAVPGVLDEAGDRDHFVWDVGPDSQQVLWFRMPEGTGRTAVVQMLQDGLFYASAILDRSAPLAVRPGADGRTEVIVTWSSTGASADAGPLPYELALAPAADDHGHMAADATPLGIGQPMVFTIDAIGDEDTFRVDVRAGHDYRATARPVEPGAGSASSDAIPPLFQVSPHVGSFVVTRSGSEVIWHVDADASMTMAVFGYSGDGTETGFIGRAGRLLVEDITSTGGARGAGFTDPIDTDEDLEPVALGESRMLVGSVAREETHHVRVPVAAGERILMTMSPGAAWAMASLEDSLATDVLHQVYVTTPVDGHPVRGLFEAPRAGILDVTVQGSNWRDDGVMSWPYRLWLVSVAADDHADTPAGATPLPPGVRLKAELEDPDRDLFAVDLVAGQRIGMQVDVAEGSWGYYSLVEESAWVMSGSAWDGATSTTHFTVDRSGRYILMLQGYGQMDVSWQTVPPDDHGDLPGDATELVPLVLTGQTTTMDDLPGW